MAVCTHLDTVTVTQLPEAVDGCEECLRDGGVWLHLRICLGCGHVGCCDDSPGKHATAVAYAASPSIHVSPATVHAGKRVEVSGSAGGCPAGDQVTLISRAFSRRHEFAGVAAVFARVRSNGTYSVSTRIPSRRHGRY